MKKYFVFLYVLMGTEIVNGSLNDTHFAASYCPKTKTSYVFNRQIDGELHTFKASGVLFNLRRMKPITGKPTLLTLSFEGD